ncbi:transporter substrate-binding domain-containing protein [Candidatus Dependentiae bacterium]|nr:transporter substrate-binding domain-containing protein [Candidatus Dependentiae bacterium]
MNKKEIMIGLFIVIVTILTLLLFFKRQHGASENMFIVGTAAGYAPFVSVNELGEYEGFDIDVINEVSKQMDKKLMLKDLGSMTPLFIALEQGTIDAAIWGLSITKDRLKKVTMVKYQGDTISSYPMIFWKKIPKGVVSITDMRDMTVCVEPHSSQDAVLQKYNFINTKPTEKVDDALLNIQYNKADAAFVEPAIANKFKKKYPEVQTLDVQLSEEDQVYGIGIAIRKDNNIIIDSVKKAIQQLDAQGVIHMLEQKWSIE